MPAISQTVDRVIQAVSIKYNNIVYEMKQAGDDVIVLSLGEAFFDIPLFPMDDLPMPAVYHYSHSRGIIELRKLLADFFAKTYDVHFDPETEIIVTAGSKAAIHMAFMAMLDPGDEVVILEPYWVSYTEQVRLCQGVPVSVPLETPVTDLERFITPRTRCIVVNNPNNPGGHLYSLAELQTLYALAQKHDIFLLADEAYSEFVLDPKQFHSLGSVDKHFTHSIVCNSISKNYGLSGWRLGYVIGNPTLINAVLKVNQHLVTCPATILEHYIARHFYEILEITRPQIRAVVEKRAQVLAYMDKIGLKYLPGDSTFYTFVSIDPSSLDSDAFCTRLLREFHVCAVPGIGYGASCDRHIRVSVGTESWERTTRGLDIIRALVAATTPR